MSYTEPHNKMRAVTPLKVTPNIRFFSNDKNSTIFPILWAFPKTLIRRLQLKRTLHGPYTQSCCGRPENVTHAYIYQKALGYSYICKKAYECKLSPIIHKFYKHPNFHFYQQFLVWRLFCGLVYFNYISLPYSFIIMISHTLFFRKFKW